MPEEEIFPKVAGLHLHACHCNECSENNSEVESWCPKWAVISSFVAGHGNRVISYRVRRYIAISAVQGRTVFRDIIPPLERRCMCLIVIMAHDLYGDIRDVQGKVIIQGCRNA